MSKSLRWAILGRLILFVAGWIWSAAPLRAEPFTFTPPADQITSATFSGNFAAYTAHNFVAGIEVNSVKLLGINQASLDLSEALFGTTDALTDAPLVDQGLLGTGLISTPIPASFFPALAFGSVGIDATFTDTLDGLFAIDFLELTIVTPTRTIVSKIGPDNRFGIGLLLGADLPGPLPGSLSMTGTGFDEAITSKSIFLPPVPEPGSLSLMLGGLAGILFLVRRRRKTRGATELGIPLQEMAPEPSAAPFLLGGLLPWRRKKREWLLLLFVLLLITHPFRLYADPPSVTHIPIVINLYKDSGISADDAKKAVEEASKILAQAEFKLTVVKVNSPFADGDTVVDWSTRGYDKVSEAGKKEIENTPNKKGIKVSFVKEPEKGDTNPGWSFHRQPVVCVKNRGTATKTGETIAHEIGHVLSLVGTYKIAEGVMADTSGHAPDKPGDNGNGNLMAPSNRRTGTKLSAAQIAEMQKERFKRGKCSTQFQQAFPAQKEQQQNGARTDPNRDQDAAFDYQHLTSLYVWSLAGDTLVHAQLSTGGVLTGLVSSTYSLAIDSDNNSTTGVLYKLFAGTDYAVELTVSGSGPYTVSGLVRRLSDGAVFPLPTPPEIAPGNLVPDSDGSVIHDFDEFLFDVPKSLIGLTSATGNIPIGLTSESNGTIIDQDRAIFDLNRWLEDPTLATFGAGIPVPGTPYAFQVSGLQPNSAVNFFVDERTVFAGTTDSSGGLSSSFTFPSDLPSTTPHFLTAQDSTGEFAYSMTCPDLRNPDQLHATGPIPNRLAVGSAGTITASVQQDFGGLAGQEVTFSRLLGNVAFTSGSVSSDASTSTVVTNVAGISTVNFLPQSPGLALIGIGVKGTSLKAYVLITGI
jgi:hypothetical protein